MPSNPPLLLCSAPTFCFLPTVLDLHPTCSWVEMSGWAGTVSHFLFPVCVCVSVCARFWLPPPPPTPPACLRLTAVKQERDKLPVSAMFSNLTLFSVCYLLSSSCHSCQPRCHTISCFLGCCVDLLKEVRTSLLLPRLRFELLPVGAVPCDVGFVLKPVTLQPLRSAAEQLI